MHFATGPTGAGPCRDSAIRSPSCSFWDLRPRRMAQIGRDVFSRGIARGIFCMRLFTRRALQISLRLCGATMACGLKNAYIAATIRCAPPANKPHPSEIINCRSYLVRELEILQPRARVGAGKNRVGCVPGDSEAARADRVASGLPFAHGAEAELPGDCARLFGVYHPSQQNTQTGRVTPAMYGHVLRRIRRFLAEIGAIRRCSRLLAIHHCTVGVSTAWRCRQIPDTTQYVCESARRL